MEIEHGAFRGVGLAYFGEKNKEFAPRFANRSWKSVLSESWYLEEMG